MDTYLREPYLQLPPAEWRMAAALARLHDEARTGVCDTGRYRMRFFDLGDTDAPVVVFVHGISDRPCAFAEVMVSLADTYRCVAYELPDGAGDGAQLSTYRHEDLADDLFRLLDHLGLESAYPVGFSFGSTVVMRALIMDPSRLPAAVIQGAFARRPLRWVERVLTQFARYFPGTMAGLPLRDRAQRAIDYSIFDTASPGVWEFFQATTGSNRNAAVARRAILLHELDLRPYVPGIVEPVLMLGCEQDRIIPAELQYWVRDTLPEVRWVEMDGCGHYPHYLAPDRVAESIQNFLSDHSKSTSEE